MGHTDQVVIEEHEDNQKDGWGAGRWRAALFAKNLAEFDTSLARKAVRFDAHDDKNRAAQVIKRIDEMRGYASGFQGIFDAVALLVRHGEQIGSAFREQVEVFPNIAIRKLIANALIHQDLTIMGAGPLIELFSDRIEVTNPGEPLVSVDRFIDSPPRSRNEALAAFMRRMRICEEQGTGIDKSVAAVEGLKLPPPDFRVEGNACMAVIYAPRCFATMTPDERLRACYQHAVLRYVSDETMRNATLRERFGIEKRNSAQVSQVIRLALNGKLIRPADPARPKAGYVPFRA